jgi:hypothetical protein
LEWLRNDCSSNGTAADLIMHLGDHAYNEGDDDERRADSYMNAYQPTLSGCPWLPVVGNHEYSGMQLSRYLNSTWEGWGPISGGNVTSADAVARVSSASSSNSSSLPPAAKVGLSLRKNISAGGVGGGVGVGGGSSGSGGGGDEIWSTATSALGKLLSLASHHGTGTVGSTPSNTSRYFSVDFGLIHLIGLDFNLYYGVDACGEPCRLAQLKWLQEDLAAAVQNRDKVPWILASSHFPVFCTGCGGNGVKGGGPKRAAVPPSEDVSAAYVIADGVSSAHAHLPRVARGLEAWWFFWDVPLQHTLKVCAAVCHTGADCASVTRIAWLL